MQPRGFFGEEWWSERRILAGLHIESPRSTYCMARKRLAQLKGLVVASDKRNTRIVTCLIASMTFGAALLLWLEPTTPGWSATTLLMAESGRAIEDVQVEFIDSGNVLDAADCDCVVMPDGTCQWRPAETRIRLAVVAPAGDQLSKAQAETLLAVFGTMTQRHGLDLKHVWLHPSSDARLHPELPASAYDLCDLLVRKGIIP